MNTESPDSVMLAPELSESIIVPVLVIELPRRRNDWIARSTERARILYGADVNLSRGESVAPSISTSSQYCELKSTESGNP